MKIEVKTWYTSKYHMRTCGLFVAPTITTLGGSVAVPLTPEPEDTVRVSHNIITEKEYVCLSECEYV